MKAVEEILEWADSHANQLETEMAWHSGQYGSYWKAQTPAALDRIVARAVAALEFLQKYAGEDSQWFARATATFDSGDNDSTESGARAIGEILRAWASQVRSGVIDIAGVASADLRSIASTNLMTQVRQLLEDKSVHAAAPVVLAGAALEMALRAAVEERQLHLAGRPSISAYGQCLRTAGLLTVQDIKNIEQMAGLRNDAAHGHFDNFDRKNATLMEQQVNLFLDRLGQVLDE